MRITNVNTLGALLDRLVTENIKLFFFEKEGDKVKSSHQRHIIEDLKKEMAVLFEEVNDGNYDPFIELRTFKVKFPEEVVNLILNDIRIGEADRARLEEATSENPDFYRMAFNEIRLRIANEGRASNKNKIDTLMRDVI